MFKRICGLLVAITLPVLLLAVIDQAEGLVGETAVVDTYNIIINEIHADPHGTLGDANGDGVRDGSDDEFVELINASTTPVDISGWEIHDDVGNKHTFPANTILSGNCAAVVVFGGGSPTGSFGGSLVQTASSGHLLLNNSGDTVYVYAADASLVISYTYGSEGGEDQSLTRHPDIVGGDPLVRHNEDAGGGLFSPGTQVNGDPFNACPSDKADLSVSKQAPVNAQPGDIIVYDISLQNNGVISAQNSFLTDSLPASLAYLSDSSGYPLVYSSTQTLVWDMGTVFTDTIIQFHLTGTIAGDAVGTLYNYITATTTTSETILGNNSAVASTNINIPPRILIDAVLYDGIERGDPDEAVRLWNGGSQAVDLSEWRVSDGGVAKVISGGLTIAAGEGVWLAGNAAAFTRQFGFAPDRVLSEWPGFSNDGDEVLLLDDAGQIVDALIYENGDTSVGGWSGTAVQPYSPSSAFAQTGQILYRMRDQITGQPVPDTNTAADWAQSTGDVINGRKIRYPGWDLDEFFQTMQVTETAVLTIAIAPDNAYHALVAEIDSAVSTIEGESLTLESVAITEALIRAANRGVTVTLLLEGGGVSDQENYVCRELEAAGGLCNFMINDADASPKIYDRYRYLHAKFLLIDGRRTVISTQNFTPTSLPDDDKSDGSWGRRGVLLITDAPQVVGHVQTIFDRDYDLAHQDIITGTSHLDPLPLGFVPITTSGGITSVVRFPQPLAVQGTFSFELVQSPENSLRDADGLLGMVNRAGAGDVVLVQQLYERPYWGASSSNSTDDPNPRLEAYLSAARRGARVRLLLDIFFDNGWEATSNAATCAYVRAIASAEHLALECALGNPTGLGIHNKMVLVQADGRGYIHIGSINGSELSSKGNRELALQVQSDEAYALLAEMFNRDWPYRVYLPIMLNNVHGPASHLLISEIQYNPPGTDDDEYVEIVNPTSLTVDMSGFSLGDAVNRSDFEDVRRFPAGTTLAPRTTLVVAGSAAAFYAEFNAYPDFEILETVTAVPNLIDDPAWGDTAASFQLGNTGDEVLLRNSQDQVIDVVTYGSGSYPGVIPHPLVILSNAVLERYPYWQDTDDCVIDFREWPYPSPGTLPD